MGIEVVVEDEGGTEMASIEDPTNILHRLLPTHDDKGFKLLNSVDWYGDTTFNRKQIADVRRELRLLTKAKRSVEELELIRRIDSLAGRVEVEPHLYLKFYGD